MTKYVLYSSDAYGESNASFWSASLGTWVDYRDPNLTFYTQSEADKLRQPNFSPDGYYIAEFVPWQISSELGKAIESARKQIERDPSLAVYTVRDYQEVAMVGLRSLAWCMGREGSCSKDEAKWLLDTLEIAFLEQPSD